jgi:peroxiredoxin
MKQRTFVLTLATVFVLFGLLGCILLSIALWQVAIAKTDIADAIQATPQRSTAQPDPGEAVVGEMAPDFTLVDTRNDKQVSLNQFDGQPVMLNFWATWCPPCRKEMPLLQDAYEKHQDDGLEILTIAVSDKANNVLDFSDQHDLTFPLLIDTKDRVAVQYKIMGIPTSYFIDSNGVIASVQVGDLTASALNRHLEEILDD